MSVECLDDDERALEMNLEDYSIKGTKYGVPMTVSSETGTRDVNI